MVVTDVPCRMPQLQAQAEAEGAERCHRSVKTGMEWALAVQRQAVWMRLEWVECARPVDWEDRAVPQRAVRVWRLRLVGLGPGPRSGLDWALKKMQALVLKQQQKRRRQLLSGEWSECEWLRLEWWREWVKGEANEEMEQSQTKKPRQKRMLRLVWCSTVRWWWCWWCW